MPKGGAFGLPFTFNYLGGTLDQELRTVHNQWICLSRKPLRGTMAINSEAHHPTPKKKAKPLDANSQLHLSLLPSRLPEKHSNQVVFVGYVGICKTMETSSCPWLLLPPMSRGVFSLTSQKPLFSIGKTNASLAVSSKGFCPHPKEHVPINSSGGL